MSKIVHYALSYRQRVCDYAIKHNNKSEAAVQYGVSRPTLDRWLKRYDGSKNSLKDKSRRPHSHPNEHSAAELELIFGIWDKNKQFGLDYVFGKLKRKHEYKRSRTSLYRVLVRHGKYTKAKKKRKGRKPREYIAAKLPGEKLQVDVKYVPMECVVGKIAGQRLYQYTAIDECTGLRYIDIFEDKTSETAAKFIYQARKYFPFEIMKIQTDNGTEFTNRFVNTKNLAYFEKYLKQEGIEHKLIRPGTPWHNGRVERSHRTDQKFFYDLRTFYSIEDAKCQIKKHLRRYNNMPQRRYNYQTPMEVLEQYLWLI